MKHVVSPCLQVSRFGLFLAFSRITLSGFGGIMFWARRILVDRQRWLTDKEFAELLTLGQLLPGPPGLNLTVMVGYRLAGWTGAASAVAGFLAWPCLVVVGLGVLYQQYGSVVQVRQALGGMSAVAAGLVLSTAIRLAMAIPWRWQTWLFGMLAFAGIGLLRWPLLWVIGGLAPFAVAAVWREKD